MVSKFHTAFAASGFGPLMAELGEAVVYTPFGTDPLVPVNIWGIFDDSSLDLEERDERGLKETERARLTIGTDPALAVYGGVASPKPRDVVVVDGVTWVVVGFGDKKVGTVELELEKDTNVERTAGGVRAAR